MRAQVEIQFNWIYVAVVGGMILLLFAGMIVGLRRFSQRGLDRDAVAYFDEIFTSLQSSENTEHEVNLAGLELEVKSTAQDCNSFIIGSQTRSTVYLPLFSPDLISGRLYSYTLGWNVPFRANYFLFLSGPKVGYGIHGSDLNMLYNDLPDHLAKRKINQLGDFENQNYDKVRIITTQTPSPLDGSLNRVDDVSVMQIVPSGDLYDGGTVKYYEGVSPQLEDEYPYIDKATLFALIYADSPDAYVCNMGKALDRLHESSSVLKKRVQKIKAGGLNPTCQAYTTQYDSAEEKFQQIIDATATPGMSSLTTIGVIANQLRSINTDLNRASCPTIY